MCGLTACLDYNVRAGVTNGVKKHSNLEAEIDESLEIVKHRGPDARGQWISSDSCVGMMWSSLGVQGLTLQQLLAM